MQNVIRNRRNRKPRHPNKPRLPNPEWRALKKKLLSFCARISPNQSPPAPPSGCVAARRRWGSILRLVKVLAGFQDFRISRTRHHLLAVAVDGGAHLWGSVPGLPCSGLERRSREGQIHHVEHVSQAPGHLRKGLGGFKTC